MMPSIKNPGLKPLPQDDRDFSVGGIIKQIPISEVPNDDFIVAEPLLIRDQGDTDYCSAYAAIAVSEDQEEVLLLPEYQFFLTKEISGRKSQWGADLRSAMKALKKGSIAQKGHERFKSMSREDILNPVTWPKQFPYIRQKYAKRYFIDAGSGRYDLFDNLRVFMWQYREEKCSIVVGSMWRPHWTYAERGIIPKTELSGGFGHAFKIYGQKVIDGELHLVAQLSNGTDIGDSGIFYFPREVVNREFGPYGQYSVKDLSDDVVAKLLEGKVETNFINTIINKLISFLRL